MEDLKEQLVSFETAKLAKEKGFDELVCDFYQGNELVHDYGKDLWAVNNSLNKIAVPTQSLLQKWLREKHNINVEIFQTSFGWQWIVKNTMFVEKNYCRTLWHSITYEHALEDGLQAALKFI